MPQSSLGTLSREQCRKQNQWKWDRLRLLAITSFQGQREGETHRLERANCFECWGLNWVPDVQ